MTGRKPFEGTSQASVIAAILERDQPASNGHVLAPPALDRLVRKCLAKDPDERWQTAKDLGDELRWVVHSGASAIVPDSGVERGVGTRAPGRDRIARRRRFIFRVTIGISLSALLLTKLDARIAQRTGGSVSVNATGELEKLYHREVVARCRLLGPGRYPFGSGTDMALADFGAVFGYGGLFDKFFTDHIDRLVDRSQRPWTWRPQSMAPPAGMLAEFERAERIRRMFFSAGSKTPKLGFIVRLSNLDPSASRFYVYIDGQTAQVMPGRETRIPMEWPGAGKRGVAVALFEDRTTAPEQVAAFEGPWALFRLIDAGRMQPVRAQPETGLNSMLRFQTSTHQAQVVIEAANATSNPFASRDWRQFNCEP